MANLRIAYLNRADSATITADPAADADYPVANLQNDSRGRVFRSSSVAAQSIKGTWGGTAYTISMCALNRHNLVTNDTWRLYLYPNDDWTGTPLYDSTAVDAFVDNTFDDWDYGFSVIYFTATAAVKSFKLVLTSSANPDAYVEAQRLFLGPYTEAEYQPAEGALAGWQSASKQTALEGGSISASARGQWRKLLLDMMVDTEANRAVWMEIARYCSIVETFWVSIYPGVGGTSERDHGMFAKFLEDPMQKITQNRWDFSIPLREI